MTYIQQAYKGKTELWMFIITSVLVGGIFVANFVLLFMMSPEEQQAMMDTIKEIPANINLVLNLAPFAVLLALLFLLVKFMHHRSILSLTTARPKVDWSRVAFSFGLIAFLTLGSFAVTYFIDSSQIELQFNPTKFAVLLVLSLLLFPFQIGLEEYLFRGYLMQHLGILVKNKWFPLVITSIFFGLAHSGNPEVAEMGYITMVFYIGTGLLLGIMTLMDDGLELALGFHFGNNLLAALLITSDWSALQTDAVFRYTAEQSGNPIAEVILPVLIFYPIILLVFARKYEWSGWKEKLTGKVVPVVEQQDQ